MILLLALLTTPEAHAQDSDGDWLDDQFEWDVLGTWPDRWDSDYDGLGDGEEYYYWGTVPWMYDSDSDGLSDSQEVLYYGTDALDADNDDGGLADGLEVQWSLDLWNPSDDLDRDGDRVPDVVEVELGLDPLDVDSDHDFADDYNELIGGTQPDVPDTDMDGLVDGIEPLVGLNPFVADFAGFDICGFLDDGANIQGRQLLAQLDHDDDGFENPAECYFGTDPRDADTDDDCVSDSADTRPTIPGSDVNTDGQVDVELGDGDCTPDIDVDRDGIPDDVDGSVPGADANGRITPFDPSACEAEAEWRVGRRRVLLTDGTAHADTLRLACPSGFHMARISDLAAFATLAPVDATGACTSWPEGVVGWVSSARAGSDHYDCRSWRDRSSNVTAYVAGFDPDQGRFVRRQVVCDEPQQVWCVED